MGGGGGEGGVHVLTRIPHVEVRNPACLVRKWGACVRLEFRMFEVVILHVEVHFSISFLGVLHIPDLISHVRGQRGGGACFD